MKKKTIIIIIVSVVAFIFILMVAVAGIGFFIAKRVQQKVGITNMHIDKQGSGKIEFQGGQIELGKTATWPTDMPSDVPEFTYGKVKMVTKSEVENKKGWNILLEEVTADAPEKYKADLKNSGWSIKATTTVSDQGGSIMAEQDKLQLFIFIDSEKHTASIGVNEKN